MGKKKIDLKEHLHKEHHFTFLGEYLENIVYGGMDGIITTFAVVAGFTGAAGVIDSSLSYSIVLLFGLANLLADGFSMGLGNFLSLRAERDVYLKNKKIEEREINENPEGEALETKQILMGKGYNEEDAEAMVELYKKNKKFWVSFMMDYELEMANSENNKPFLNGLITFIAFSVFGIIPISPYFFKPDNAFFIAVLSTSFALILLGLLRWKITKIDFLRSVLETFIVGGVAAIVAYFVGTFFEI